MIKHVLKLFSVGKIVLALIQLETLIYIYLVLRKYSFFHNEVMIFHAITV